MLIHTLVSFRTSFEKATKLAVVIFTLIRRRILPADGWPGDEVYLEGDNDSSDFIQVACNQYTDIAKELVTEYNQFIQHKKCQL